MSTDTQAAEQVTGTRTFYRSDYRRAAKMVQRMRHVKGDPYTAKSPEQMAAVDGLAGKLAAVFSHDAGSGPGPEFDAEKFLAGTRLPQAPAGDGSEDEAAPAEDEPGDVWLT